MTTVAMPLTLLALSLVVWQLNGPGASFTNAFVNNAFFIYLLAFLPAIVVALLHNRIAGRRTWTARQHVGWSTLVGLGLAVVMGILIGGSLGFDYRFSWLLWTWGVATGLVYGLATFAVRSFQERLSEGITASPSSGTGG